MKKPFKHLIFIIALLVISAMISCVSDSELIPYPGGGEYEEGDRAVSVRLINALSAGSNNTAMGGEYVDFNTGTLFLVNSWGAIIRHFTITDDNAPLTSNSVGRETLEDGVIIENVPGTIAEVVVVGNTTVPTTGNINTLLASPLNIGTQGNVTNVNLVGREELNFSHISAITGNSVYYAYIELEPTVARFEIARITSEGRVLSFEVAGIFIDHYYASSSISGLSRTTWRTHESGTGELYEIFSNTNTNLTPALARTGSWAAPAPDRTVTPGAASDAVWGFQVFAEKSSVVGTLPITEGGSRYPQIAIKLRNVVLSGTNPTPLAGYHFVTVTGFRENDVRLEGIRALHVYHIANLIFNETHLNTTIDVCVSVTLGVWNGRDIYANMPLRQHNPAHGFMCAGVAHTFSFYPATGAPTGGTGNYTYQWQRSANGATGWAAVIGNVTATSRYLTIAANQTGANDGYWFRRRVYDGLNPAIYSSPAQLTLTERIYDFPEYVIIGTHADNNPIRWATRNVDLSTRTGFTNHPADGGMFFQWGRNVGWHPTDGASPRAWNPVTNQWETRAWSNTTVSSTFWAAEHDPCPTGWRVPTDAELLVLNGAGSVWLDANEAAERGLGCKAGRLYGTYPNQVFLPAFGRRANVNGLIGYVGTAGHYWSNTRHNLNAWYLRSRIGYSEMRNDRLQSWGYNVRCVRIPPAMPLATSRVTAFVSVQYDFQSQPLEAFGIANVIYWQWQVSQSNSTNDSDWTNTTSMLTTNTWTLPADFMHTTLAPNADGNLYFRAVKTLANGTRVTQEPANVLQIRFIQTTVAGGSSRFLDGFGMTPQGVRYAVMNRARHNNSPANPNTIRVALLNLGATNYDGGLGSLFQWGRYADGHQLIGWYNHPGTGATRFTPGRTGAGGVTTSTSSVRSGTFNADGQPAVGNPIRPNYILAAGTGTSGDWSTRPANDGTGVGGNRNLWGAGATGGTNTTRPTRANTPTALSGWTARAQNNNPCAHLGAGWRVPTHFEWVDMHSGTGVSGTGNADSGVNLSTHPSGTHNTWDWHPPSSNGSARGGMIITNPNNEATVILPAAPFRVAITNGADIPGFMSELAITQGIYWTSTQNTASAALQVEFFASRLWIRRPLNTNSADTRYRAHGFSVRCVVD